MAESTGLHAVRVVGERRVTFPQVLRGTGRTELEDLEAVKFARARRQGDGPQCECGIRMHTA